MKINLLDIPVFYINMKKDVEKNNHMKKMLEDLGFKNVTRIEAVEDKVSGRRGLSKSQYKALTQVPPPFIVLEDDCQIKYFKSEINIPDDTDAFYLGNSAWGILGSHTGFVLRYQQVKEMPEVYRIFNMLSSHAILYLSNDYVSVCQRTTNYCANVAKNPYPMDIPFAEIQKYYNVYTMNKPLFIQKDYDSKMSNAPKWTNRRLTEYRVDNRIHSHLYIRDEIL